MQVPKDISKMYLLEHCFCGIPVNSSMKKWLQKICCIYLMEHYATSKRISTKLSDWFQGIFILYYKVRRTKIKLILNHV